MILPYDGHCIDMTPSPEPINGATGTWLSYALQRVIGWELSCTCIVTSLSQRRRPKHGGFPDRWGRLAMLTEENLPSKYNVNERKVCKFKDEDLKILGR